MPAAKKKSATARAPKRAILTCPDFIKVSATGKKLPASAENHAAVICTKYRTRSGLPLMFTARDLGSHSYEAALKLPATFELLGEKDWRLPDATESAFMLNRANWPAKDAQFFPGEAGWQWTGEPTSDSSYAFGVSLRYGCVDWSYRYRGGLVRLCREVSPRQALAFGIPVGPGAAKGKR
jgi:hypothetical protein